METFSFVPTSQASNPVDHSVLSARYGDGYQQDAGNAINGQSESWQLTFAGTKSDLLEIKAFLDDKQGYKSFLWASPTNGLLLWKAKTYTMTPLGGLTYSLTVTFNQSFQP